MTTKFLVLLFLTVFHCAIFAQDEIRYLSKTVTVSFSSTPLLEAFEQIGSQAECYFSYNDALINKARTVTFDAQNQSVAQALQLCLRDTTLRFREIDNQIIIYRPRKRDIRTAKTIEEIPDPIVSPVLQEVVQIVYSVPLSTAYDTVRTSFVDTLVFADTVVVYDTVIVQNTSSDIQRPKRPCVFNVHALYGFGHLYGGNDNESTYLTENQNYSASQFYGFSYQIPMQKRGFFQMGFAFGVQNRQSVYSKTYSATEETAVFHYETYLVDEYLEFVPGGDTIPYQVYDSTKIVDAPIITSHDTTVSVESNYTYSQLFIPIYWGFELMRHPRFSCTLAVGIIPALTIRTRGNLVVHDADGLASANFADQINVANVYAGLSVGCSYLLTDKISAGVLFNYMHSMHGVFQSDFASGVYANKFHGGMQFGYHF